MRVMTPSRLPRPHVLRSMATRTPPGNEEGAGEEGDEGQGDAKAAKAPKATKAAAAVAAERAPAGEAR